MRYEKTYFDLVSAEGVVCVAYASQLELFGFTLHAAGIELYGADGSRRVWRASSRAVRREQGRETELSFALAGGRFRIRQHAVHGPFAPEGAALSPHLDWRVRTARAETVVELELDGASERIHGRGYEDTVIIDAPTRKLGLATIEWGRAHVGDETWVFNVVGTLSGARWSRGCRFGSGAAEPGAIELVRSERGLSVRCSGAQESLDLATERVLHAGEALDELRFPGRVERALTRALTGPIFERRTVASASLGVATGWAIEERIELGPNARARSAV